MRWGTLLCCAVSLPLAAQTFQFGTAADNCTSGSAIYAGPPSLRYGIAFTCSVSVPPGFYWTTLGFTEPNQTTAGARVFSVTVNGYATSEMRDIDLVRSGAIDPTVVVTRSAPAMVVDGQLRVAITAKVRSGVISSIGVQRMDSVPYMGAGKDLDLGDHLVVARGFRSRGDGPGKIGITAGPAPADTTVNDIVYDAVLYLDSVDLTLKLLRKDGTVTSVTPTR